MAWILPALIMAGAAALRLHLLHVPLDRDEREYAYVARLLLDRIPPFADAHNMKMPGIYAVYSVLLTVFGSTHTAIHLGLLFANALSIALVFLLGRRLMDATAGVAAAATYALLTLSETVLGSAANAEHFVVPLALSALVLLDSARERSHLTRLLLAGLLLGLAVLVKQHGVFFLAFALLVVALARQWRRAVVLLAAAMMPAAALVALAGISPLWAERTYLFELTPTMVARRLYGGNPFPEALEVARYIRERSAPADRIAVLGSEPEIYFYSGRRAATGYCTRIRSWRLSPTRPGCSARWSARSSARGRRFSSTSTCRPRG